MPRRQRKMAMRQTTRRLQLHLTILPKLIQAFRSVLISRHALNSWLTDDLWSSYPINCLRHTRPHQWRSVLAYFWVLTELRRRRLPSLVPVIVLVRWQILSLVSLKLIIDRIYLCSHVLLGRAFVWLCGVTRTQASRLKHIQRLIWRLLRFQLLS